MCLNELLVNLPTTEARTTATPTKLLADAQVALDTLVSEEAEGLALDFWARQSLAKAIGALKEALADAKKASAK